MSSFHPLHLWTQMGVASKAVTIALLLMGVCAVTVAVERIVIYLRASRETSRMMREVGPLFARWKLHTARERIALFPRSPLGHVLAATLDKFESGDGSLLPIERARREAERQVEAAGARLRRGLGVLASVGSTAPFVGLLGTVVGIISAFQGIAATGSGGLGAVSAGISEALIETALGLLVAIPAVLFFNYLSTRAQAIEADAVRAMGEVLDELENGQSKRTSTILSAAA